MSTALALAGCGTARPTFLPTPAYTDAEAACRAPATAEKGGTQLQFSWTAAVRLDHGDTAVLLFVSGTDELLCETTRDADGIYATTVTGLGRLDSTSAVLSVDTGMGPPATGGPRIIAGRVPEGTAGLEVISADGLSVESAVGGGRYVAWIQSGEPVVRVSALNAAGPVISQLADPAGLRAGTEAQPGGLVVRLANHDAQDYLVILAPPSAGGTSQSLQGWLLPAGAAGTIERTALGGGELQVRTLGCDAVASWPVGDQQYSAEVREQAASVQAVESLPAAPELAPVSNAERCYFSGP